MSFRLAFLACAALGLAACDPAGPAAGGASVYKIRSGDTSAIQQNMLQSVNAMRAARGAPPLRLNAQLSAAANAQAREMSRQRRAWPFGANGSTPYDRVRAAGYSGNLLTELYSQSFESEQQTLAAWVQDGAWGAELFDPVAQEMGVGWQQDSNGLIWWAITLGDGGYGSIAPAS
ncbi:MAG: CAP domain-containing protein [Mangrovicoccus sp.]|nr:CAP domain-containing protein [Mangrovicoccus sp.]